jgi:putative Ca2+/H+ antiporter (TMEM165/GDT1 family)
MIDYKLMATVFSTVFIAEMGDKTQVSTLLFSANAGHSRTTVFVAASAALILTSAIGVLVGGLIYRFMNPRIINWLAGLGFIAVGMWTLTKS